MDSTKKMEYKSFVSKKPSHLTLKSVQQKRTNNDSNLDRALLHSAYFTISFEASGAQHIHLKNGRTETIFIWKIIKENSGEYTRNALLTPGIRSVTHKAVVVSQRLCKQHSNKSKIRQSCVGAESYMSTAESNNPRCINRSPSCTYGQLAFSLSWSEWCNRRGCS